MRDKIKDWLDASGHGCTRIVSANGRVGDCNDLLTIVHDCFRNIGLKWISVDNHIPTKDEMVLMCTVDFDKDLPRYSCGSFNGLEWWHKNELGGSWQPTHWMPLIKAPSNED